MSRRFLALLAALCVTPAPLYAQAELWLAPGVTRMPTDRMGPFVRLRDGGILTVDGTAALVSRDEGKTWSGPIPMFARTPPVQISNERALLVTKDGTVIAAFMNLKARSQGFWDAKTKALVPDVRLEVWAVRSADNGKTWSDAQCVQKGYAGAVRALVQAANGNVVLATQNVAHDPARHVTTAYYSTDEGRTWQPASYLDREGVRRPNMDIGGHGHHDGAIEPTVELLKDGRLWMLIRTGHDWFWQAFSADHGVTWTDFEKSTIQASAAPGMLKRLASGRLLLAWNQLYPEGKSEYRRLGPDWHKVPASYHREELSVAFSADDGRSWSKPVVIAKQPGKWVSYPYVFERALGELWVSTMQGGLRVQLREKDFLAEPGSRKSLTVSTPVPFGMRLRKAPTSPKDVSAPAVVAEAPDNESVLVRLPDDTLKNFYVVRPSGKEIRSRTSRDGGLTWGDDRLEIPLPGAAYHAVQVLLDRAGELHAAFHVYRGAGKQAGVDLFLDLWHCKTTGGRARWGEPQRVFDGFVGALRGFTQLRTGRLVLPFARAVPEWKAQPPAGQPDHGWHKIVVLTSDDGGASWRKSPQELRITLDVPFITRYGAVEPHVRELRDGRVWMLIRDRGGRLHESFSPDGVTWSEPRKSLFVSSDSPACTLRLADGRLALFWCACQRWDDPRSYARGGREALHAAVSDDDGRTWRGFREVLHEPDGAPPRGDRGTAYPSAVQNKEGKVVLASGQGEGRRAVVLFDPEWLTAATAADDFSRGLEQWTGHGARGVRVVDDPAGKGLCLCREEAAWPAAAVWNFPMTPAGTLTARLQLEPGCGGATLALTDHFSVAGDAGAAGNGLYLLTIGGDGSIDGRPALRPGRWHELSVRWEKDGPAAVILDGREVSRLPRRRATTSGPHYLRLRNLTAAAEAGGLLVGGVRVGPKQ